MVKTLGKVKSHSQIGFAHSLKYVCTFLRVVRHVNAFKRPLSGNGSQGGHKETDIWERMLHRMFVVVFEWGATAGKGYTESRKLPDSSQWLLGSPLLPYYSTHKMEFSGILVPKFKAESYFFLEMQPREKGSPELVPGMKEGLIFYSLTSHRCIFEGVNDMEKEQLPPPPLGS